MIYNMFKALHILGLSSVMLLDNNIYRKIYYLLISKLLGLSDNSPERFRLWYNYVVILKGIYSLQKKNCEEFICILIIEQLWITLLDICIICCLIILSSSNLNIKVAEFASKAILSTTPFLMNRMFQCSRGSEYLLKDIDDYSHVDI